MKKRGYIAFLSVWMLSVAMPSYGQEEAPAVDVEKSAELFLENYSDAFQETFFEALKQKGIENYDKAINLLLQCKELDAGKVVVDHELAKVYLKEKQYPLAQDYALNALENEPENLWYADTFVETLRKQGKPFESVVGLLPAGSKVKENLALAYFKKKDYETALGILNTAKASKFTAELSSKINDSIKKKTKTSHTNDVPARVSGENDDSGSYRQYKEKIDQFIRDEDLNMLDQVAQEALDNYPLQPFLYYARGYALNRRSSFEEAIEVLETGLDYLVDDGSLANRFYQELSDAYNSINNSVKANMYLRKIKPGF
ncbi:tetratricopeptide repeat protein [Pseudozobellia thermophila]|uniref:Tetratricopeptide repeat-containing protein n=1 Tax=Pseudozobellia thermophila TaxID=192903 RepID=A0A1M6BRD6_9FLAO|nr:hypothetical protein [Pseudozobellia thermophila]SHI51088.1 hypothetical protein SAMN04488513_101505 [Pseudozobellia thermophila]